MQRGNFAAFVDREQIDPFDAASDLAVLRRAVADVAIGKEASRSVQTEASRALARFALLGRAMLSLLAQTSLVELRSRLRSEFEGVEAELAATQKELESFAGRKSEHLASLRERLYAALARASAELADLDDLARILGKVEQSTELHRALSMRWLLSDVNASLISSARPNALAWTLTVAETELSLLLQNRVFGVADGCGAALRRLRDRIARWRNGRRGRVLGSKLAQELTLVSGLLRELSRAAPVIEHDRTALDELSSLLSTGVLGLRLAARAAEPLTALRGLDAELDQLMLELPLDPVRTLKAISARVLVLRSFALLN